MRCAVRYIYIRPFIFVSTRGNVTRTFNLADLFEITADAVPDRVALVAGDRRLTYGELNERATRFSGHLRSAGIRPGEHVAVLSWNRAEWLETMLGTLGARAVPINVNYRYTSDEVVALLDDSDSVALVVEADLLAALGGVAHVTGSLQALRHVVVIDGDGPRRADDRPTVVGYEEALAGALPSAEPAARSSDDHYILYTGGTTGSPKGVVWRAEDIFFAALGGGNPGGDPISTPDELAVHIVRDRRPWLVTSPMMHGNGQWNSLVPLLIGRGVVLWTGRRFDAVAVAELAERERAHLLVLVGDGMAIPFLDALAARPTGELLPDLRAIGSGGAVLSPTAKARLATLLPHVTVIDGFGASETGSNGRLVGAGDGGPPRFVMGPDTAVLDDDLRPAPVGAVGRLARRGHVPLGYWNDPEKTAATFPTDAAGVRWAVPGDFARLEDDGTITLLGRGSACINTGGEKVHPEEVAIAVKSHPDVADAVVVGAPDERFGQRVVAVVVPRDGSAPGVEDLRRHLRSSLAGYKLPRSVLSVDRLQYTAQGKPDLRWAADLAATALAPSEVGR